MHNFLSGLLLASGVLAFFSVAAEDNKAGVLPLETFYPVSYTHLTLPTTPYV